MFAGGSEKEKTGRKNQNPNAIKCSVFAWIIYFSIYYQDLDSKGQHFRRLRIIYAKKSKVCNFNQNFCRIFHIDNNFLLFPLSRRHHLNNWSMAKENHDPITMLTSDAPSSKSARLPSQKSLEKAHQKSTKSSNLNNASDLFELLERCQSQRLDDQRCVLPSYFSQVS